MSANNTHSETLKTIQQRLTDRAKLFWNLAKTCQLIVLIIGIVVAFTESSAIEAALLSAFFAAGYVLLQWNSDHLKGISQAILRKYEFWDALGWEINQREISEIYVSLPKPLKVYFDSPPTDSAKYFSSTRSISARRLLENLEESAWWSKHLTRYTSRIYFTVSAIVMVIAILILVVALESTPSQSTADRIARSTVSIFVFLFTAGLFRLTYDFYRYSQTAEEIEESACMVLQKETISETEALKLYHEYQIARAGYPMIPTWVWKYRRNDLNESWDKYRQTARKPEAS